MNVYLAGRGGPAFLLGSRRLEGRKEVYSDTTLQVYYNSIEHTYRDGEEYTIRFYGDCSALTYLMCAFNEITSLDVRRNKELVRLDCGVNLLSALDVRKCSKLVSLGCLNCRITTLDLSFNRKLSNVVCDSNWLEVEDDCDYFVILDVRKTFVLLWTAFVADHSHEVRKKQKEYEAWCKAVGYRNYTPDELIREIMGRMP